MPSGRTNNFRESGRGLGRVIATIFGSTVGYPSDSLASCKLSFKPTICMIKKFCIKMTHFCSLSEFLPALVFARATCVCPSVCSSHAAIVSKQKASVMISSPPGSPTILVFLCQFLILSRHSKGFLLSWGLKQGWGRKIRPFSRASIS